MRISFLQSSLWLSGGAQVVVEYANRLSARGHQVSIVIPRGAHASEVTGGLSKAVRLVEAPVPLDSRGALKIGLLHKLRLTLAMAFAVPKSDVIIATHTPTTVVSFISAYLLRRGRPVWFYMDYPGMFANRPQEAWLLRYAMRWHHAALVLSSHSAAEAQAFASRPVYVVGLGLNEAARFQPQPAADVQPAAGDLLPRTGKRVLYLGDFRPRKGLADFLAAAALIYPAHPELELWIALKEEGSLETEVPHRRFQRPTLDELARLYAACDLFVSASWFEGFGLPPLEAMACGAPVVMTDSGGVRDYARPEENCLLVPPRRPEALAQAMRRVLEEPDLAARLRQNGPPTAAQFSWDRAADRFEAALKGIAGSSSG